MTQKQMTRSPREQRMAEYVAETPNASMEEETPEERAARTNRNWTELKKARILALRQRNQKGVDILDQELEAGRGTDFPQDADLEDADLGPLAQDDSDLGPMPQRGVKLPPTKPASQAAVRQSEPSMALIEQEADERGWEAARKEYVAKHGVLTPGKTQSQAISEATGRRDPAETRRDAEAQHAIDTGELQYGDSAFYNIAKPTASIAGFAGSGPLGAIGAEMLVRATAIGYNLNAALDKGMDEERAAEIFVNELSKGVAVDALFNIGVPVLGQVIAKIPGLNRIGDKIHAAIQKRLPGAAPKPELREARVEKLKEMTPNPNRKEAIGELAARVEGDYIPTAGQVRGKTGIIERRTYEAFPGEFQAQEEALEKAAGTMRDDFVNAGSQPTQQKLGQQIDRLAKETVEKTKARLRPVFDEANAAKLVVDFKDVADIARDALAKDAAVVGKGKLTATERAHLQGILDDYAQQPWSSAEPTLDFLSVQKAMLRKLNQDGKPTPYFEKIVGDLTSAGTKAYEEAARRMGKGDLVRRLLNARNDYRIMNESAYDGATKQVLRKGDNSPEDIAKYLWQEGKVTRIDQLDELLSLASKEGVAGPAALDKMRRNVARSFVQEAVQDVKSAAAWSESLKAPGRRATWEALTKGPSGQALRQGMEVLEQAAQIATVGPTNRQSKFMGMPVSRAVAGGGLGISWVTFGFNPVLFGAGLSIAGAMRLMATSHVHGDKGTINLLTKVLRANSTATAASAKALQALLPQLEQAAQKYDVTDLFIKDDENQQSEQK